MLLVALVVLATAQFKPGDLLGRKLNAVVPSERRSITFRSRLERGPWPGGLLTWQPSSGVRPGQPLPGGGLLPYRRRVLPRLVCLGGGFQVGRLHLLDLDQLLLDGGGLRLDALGSSTASVPAAWAWTTNSVRRNRLTSSSCAPARP
jgi:hypothetical protein